MFDWTDNQKLLFALGLVAGDFIASKGNFETIVIKKPIGIGGELGFGLALGDKQIEEGITRVKIPLYIHDIEKLPEEYKYFQGFTCNIKYNSGRAQVTDVTSGDFGIVGENVTYELLTGNVKIQGLIKEKQYKENIILCWIHITIFSEVTKNNPIIFSLVKGDTDTEKGSTILTYVDDSLYFITPLTNKNGMLTSEKLKESEDNLVDDTNIPIVGTISCILLTQSRVKPGNRGIVTILANSNIKDKFPYNEIWLKYKVNDTDNRIKSIDIKGSIGWELNWTIDNNIIEVKGKRKALVSDSCSVGEMHFEVESLTDDPYNEDYEVDLEVLESKLKNGTKEFKVTGVNGSIYWSPLDNGLDGSHGSGLGETDIVINGPIWSAGDTDITVGNQNNPDGSCSGIPGVKIPLNPGNNDVSQTIPIIKPDDKETDIEIPIISDGYILIDANFSIKIKYPDVKLNLYIKAVEEIVYIEDSIFIQTTEQQRLTLEANEELKLIDIVIKKIQESGIKTISIEEISELIGLVGKNTGNINLDRLEITELYDLIDKAYKSIKLKKEEDTPNSEMYDTIDKGSSTIIKVKRIQVKYDNTKGSIQGEKDYFTDETVILKATALTGYKFIGWIINNILESRYNTIYLSNIKNINSIEALFE